MVTGLRPGRNDARAAATSASRATAREPTPAARRPRILVAEDNEVSLAMILDTPTVHVHSIVVAGNGRETAELVRSHRPELVLTDHDQQGGTA